MKKYLSIVLILIAVTSHAQNWTRELGMNYLNADPTGAMGTVIDRGHGMAMNYGFVAPSKRLSLGIDVGLAQYGRDKSRQEYTMDNGASAPMDIIVTNTFANIGIYGNWNFMTEGPVRPYLLAKTGYSRYTTALNIYDPDDWDHCEPVDSDDLYSDGAMFATLGAGVKFDMSKIFGKLSENKLFLNASYSVTQGGNVRYMNADREVNQHQHNAPEADVVTAAFLNTQTQIVHEHHIGYLYRSTIQMTELQVGLSLNLSR